MEHPASTTPKRAYGQNKQHPALRLQPVHTDYKANAPIKTPLKQQTETLGFNPSPNSPPKLIEGFHRRNLQPLTHLLQVHAFFFFR
jgi:hypothetical protein